MAGENKVRPKGFRAILENFWYYYKYHTLITLFALVAVSVMVAQCATKTDYDYKIILAASTAELAPAQITALCDELAAYGEDLNGDGEVNVTLIDCSFSDEKSTYQTVMAKRQKLQSVLMNEEEALLIISDRACFEWIDEISENGFMEDLGLSESDGRCFALDDTAFVARAKAACYDGLAWPKELLISRRKVAGTLFEKRKNIEQSVANADAFLNKLMEENR